MDIASRCIITDKFPLDPVHFAGPGTAEYYAPSNEIDLDDLGPFDNVTTF